MTVLDRRCAFCDDDCEASCNGAMVQWELGRARRWARAWKHMAKYYRQDGDFQSMRRWANYERCVEQTARIQALEEALRHAADVLQDAQLPLNAAAARTLLEIR